MSEQTTFALVLSVISGWTTFKNASLRSVCCHVFYIVARSSFVKPPTFFRSKPKKQTCKEGRQTREDSSWGRMWRQDEVKKDTGGKLVNGIYTLLLSWAEGQMRSWTNKHATSSEPGRRRQMVAPDRPQPGEKVKRQQRLLSNSDWEGGGDCKQGKWFWVESRDANRCLDSVKRKSGHYKYKT